MKMHFVLAGTRYGAHRDYRDCELRVQARK